MVEKDKMKAVYDNDLIQLLKNLDIYQDFVAGRLRCKFCKNVITEDNLHTLFPDSGAIKISCTKTECVEQLSERLQELKARKKQYA